MLHQFLETHRSELIERCKAKVVARIAPRPLPPGALDGIPAFLSQLAESLRHEDRVGERGMAGDGQSGRNMNSEISGSAVRHGSELLGQGFTVDQVIHDYGDVCQAVTELAIEKRAAVTVEEFHTLNRCLDDAIASAVTEFDRQRDLQVSASGERAMSERLGSLAHELRNSLNVATMAFAAIRLGRVGFAGATSEVLERSLTTLAWLIDNALADVRTTSGHVQTQTIFLDRFIAKIQNGANFSARAKSCALTVHPIPSGLAVRADTQLLSAAIWNLLNNAFKFTHPYGHVALKTSWTAERVLIEVQDQCGGLGPGVASAMFEPFEQRGDDRSGLGLGLSISRRAIEACGGTLGVHDVPGTGCVFTIELPRAAAVPALRAATTAEIPT